MTRLVFGLPRNQVIVINRRPKRRTSTDVIGMTIALAVLLFALAYAITREFCQ